MNEATRKALSEIALKRNMVLPEHLEDDKLLSRFLQLLLGTDPIIPPQLGEDAVKTTLEDLAVLIEQGIRFNNPRNKYIEYTHMLAPIVTEVGSILNHICYNPSFSEKNLLQAADLLQKIGSIDGKDWAWDLLVIGLNRRKMCLLNHCLSMGYDFSLLDSESSCAVWNAIAYYHEDEAKRVSMAYLRFVRANGGNIHHQTATTGDTALHAAYRYMDFVGRLPARLLLRVGASHRIRNYKGELPRQVSREKFKIFIGRANRL